MRGGDDLPPHLGRSRLRARPRLAPGLPQEARPGLAVRHHVFDSAADPGLAVGAVYEGTCAAYERRLAQGTVTLERLSAAGPTHNAPPIVNVRISRASRRAATTSRRCTSSPGRPAAIASSPGLGGLLHPGALRCRARRACCARARPHGPRRWFTFGLSTTSRSSGSRDRRRRRRGLARHFIGGERVRSTTRFVDLSRSTSSPSPRSPEPEAPRPISQLRSRRLRLPEGWAALEPLRPGRFSFTGSPT